MTARNTSSRSIQVTWLEVRPDSDIEGGDIAGYRLNIYTIGKKRTWSRVIPGKNRTLFELRGLNVYTEYCVRVMAYNRRGDGLASDPVCAYTDTDGKSSGELDRFKFHVTFNNSYLMEDWN